MATFTKVKLSGSTDGKGIKVAASATPGTTIHTAHATALDELWLYVVNTGTTQRLLTIEYGGTTDIDNTIEQTIPAQGTAGSDGLILVIPGIILTNSLVVKAFAAAANELVVYGYINRIA